MTHDQDKYLICKQCRAAIDVSQTWQDGLPLFLFMLDHEGHGLTFAAWDCRELAGCEIHTSYTIPNPKPAFTVPN